MRAVNYLDNKNISKDIKPLFISAFPRDERPPAHIFFSSFKKKSNTLYGFYEEETFIGFTSVVVIRDICYIYFLAVSPNMRDQGYGSQILLFIKEKYKEYNLLLCYEEVKEKYKDYGQRLKREQFYLRNGFKKNPLKTNEFGVVFQTAKIGTIIITFKDYQDIFGTAFSRKILPFISEIREK